MCNLTSDSYHLHANRDLAFSPFLSFVSDVQSFDNRLRDYIGTQYVQDKYVAFVVVDHALLTAFADTSMSSAAPMSI